MAKFNDLLLLVSSADGPILIWSPDSALVAASLVKDAYALFENQNFVVLGDAPVIWTKLGQEVMTSQIDTCGSTNPAHQPCSSTPGGPWEIDMNDPVMSIKFKPDTSSSCQDVPPLIHSHLRFPQ